MVTPTVQDFVILPLCAFLGYVGLGLTGFGMAIIYLFGWQVAVLSGYKSDLKYAIFIQALALLSAQVCTFVCHVGEHDAHIRLSYHHHSLLLSHSYSTVRVSKGMLIPVHCGTFYPLQYSQRLWVN